MSRTPTLATSQRSKPKRAPEAGERILRALRAGMSFGQAARVGGISDVTLVDWRKDDPDFADACEKARCEMELTMLALIEKAAVSGQWQAATWKLERIFPERYGRKFQPITMAQEQPTGDAPGKIYRVAIEGLPVAKDGFVGIGSSFASDDNGPMG
jgi:hypothetical protein